MISVSLEAVPALLPFEEVFLSRSRSLNHLINRAVASGKKFVGEAERDVVVGGPIATARNRFSAGMNTLGEFGARLGPYLIAVSMVAFGVQHFILAEISVAQVPLWIPGNVFANYVCGTALIAAGLASSSRGQRAWLRLCWGS